MQVTEVVKKVPGRNSPAPSTYADKKQSTNREISTTADAFPIAVKSHLNAA